VEGIDQLVAACNNTVLDGMVVRTNSPKVRAARKINVEFLLSRHDSECTSCVRSGNCTLQTVANDLGISDLPYEKHLPHQPWNQDYPLIRNNDKCINCLRCIQVCEKVQATGVWDPHQPLEPHERRRQGRHTHRAVPTAPSAASASRTAPLVRFASAMTPSVSLTLSPTPTRFVVVQVAPAVRAAWGEPFGLTREKATVNRLVAALRVLGFDYVFDTDFTADLTIMEEGSELLERLKEPGGKKFPMFTSCCPGWVRYCKAHHSGFVDQLSTSKSPGQMFGAIAKSYYAELLGVDPHRIYCVEIMPCLAKKSEVGISVMNSACGDPDVDVSLTTREVDRMISCGPCRRERARGRAFRPALGYRHGRWCDLRRHGRRYGGGTQECLLPGHGDQLRRGCVQGGARSQRLEGSHLRPRRHAAARRRGIWAWQCNRLLTALEAGEVAYDFVEVMACPGGCAGGGGQPIHDGEELAGVRGDVLWGLDRVAVGCAAATRTRPSRHAIATIWASRSPTVPSTCSHTTTMHGRCLARSREETVQTQRTPVAMLLPGSSA